MGGITAQSERKAATQPEHRLMVFMPRNMRFGPSNASSIDLCVHDLVKASRYRQTTTVVCQENETLFTDCNTALFTSDVGSSSRRKSVFARRIAAEKSIDLVVVQQHLPTASNLARKLKTPVILHTHNYSKSISGTGLFDSLRRHWREKTYRSLAGIMFVSQSALERFEAEWPLLDTPKTVVPNGMDFSEWNPHSEREKEILCVGRAAPEKGIKEAAAAIASVLAQYPDWSARFILSEAEHHPGYLQDVASRLSPVSQQVAIDLNQPWSVVKSRCEAAAIAIVPSKWQEPFGRTALEAHAGGCAVITSGTGGLGEVSGGHALCLPLNFSTEHITAALIRLMCDADLRTKLARNGQAYSRSRFSIGSVSAKADDFYHSAILSNQRRRA